MVTSFRVHTIILLALDAQYVLGMVLIMTKKGFFNILQSSCNTMMKVGITNDIGERKRIIRTATTNCVSLIKILCSHQVLKLLVKHRE
ncbi:hypothetical protein C9J48_10025 [Photobacterium profundum]|uniref:Uncharacterized protein n=1 Tax=Photobacterium profundum 3TCK TaxID=314280 RepID=Q1Z3Q4_9GAMM|nr:hypothetical protein P3TCK_09658 [Photobacterium profundum 3TCK]PSV62302.1 hypothetical protein C9J48_10025 [Photobacterium profundum]